MGERRLVGWVADGREEKLNGNSRAGPRDPARAANDHLTVFAISALASDCRVEHEPLTAAEAGTEGVTHALLNGSEWWEATLAPTKRGERLLQVQAQQSPRPALIWLIDVCRRPSGRCCPHRT